LRRKEFEGNRLAIRIFDTLKGHGGHSTGSVRLGI
jgi:hypothetical protein